MPLLRACPLRPSPAHLPTRLPAPTHPPARPLHTSARYFNLAVQTLLDQNNLPHLLFYGPPGTGKTSTILAIARQIYGNAVSGWLCKCRWGRWVGGAGKLQTEAGKCSSFREAGWSGGSGGRGRTWCRAVAPATRPPACAQVGSMTLELNASDDRGIAIVRNEIQDFASTRTIFRWVGVCVQK